MSFTAVGPLVASNPDALVGVTDLCVHVTGQGSVLYAATRGGGYLTGFDTGSGAGQGAELDSWHIGQGYLQLETTDLVLYPSGSEAELLLAGLKGPELRGLQLTSGDSGALFGAVTGHAAPGVDLGTVSELTLLPGNQSGLAALRGGGLVQLTFEAGGGLSAQAVEMGPTLAPAQATAIAVAEHGGQSYAVVSYGTENTISLLRLDGDGHLEHLSDITMAGGLWVNHPAALATVSGADGGLYVVVAASGSGSLSVLKLDSVKGTLTPVDHVLDGLETRFAQASQVMSVEINGQDYVLVAGADSGLSLLAVLPGGRLHLIDTIAGSAAMPLAGITAIEVMPTPTGARIWVATESAPYLSEFSLSLENPGVSLLAAAAGGPLTGGAGGDILIGQAGADTLAGQAGDDILMDGPGADRLSGGPGADEFILVRDGAVDRITDYQPDLDKLDLTEMMAIWDPADLVVVSRPWGAELRIGDEVTEVYSASGTSLSRADFGVANFVGLDRPSLDPQDFLTLAPFTTTEPSPTQMPGPKPDQPGREAEPRLAFPIGQGGIQLGNGSDVINADNGNDFLLAGGGNDRINTFGGNDRVSGEAGNDTISAGGGSDFLDGGLGFDWLLGGHGNDTLSGGDHADVLRGGTGDDLLLGGRGYDWIYGEGGNDVVWAGETADRIYGGFGDDWLSAGSNYGYSVDGLWGEAGNDTLFGDAGFDYLDGGPGDDILDGGHQADNLFGREGDDTLFGGQGLDRLFGGPGNDMLLGGETGDGLFGEAGNDTMWGEQGNDRFFGGPGDDILSGGVGSDTIYAGAGFDTVIGGSGNDLLWGNFNADRFVFADGHGRDIVADFDALNDLEKLDFSGLSSLGTLPDVMAAASQQGADVIIITGAGTSIRLVGVNLDHLDANDFVF